MISQGHRQSRSLQ